MPTPDTMKMNNLFLGFVILTVLSSCSKPLANFAWEGSSQAPAAITFTDQSENSESVEWQFPDGTTSTDSVTMHEFLFSGDYTVELSAKKGKKTKTIEKTITINPPKNCLVLIQTTQGDMLVELYDETPLHRDKIFFE